MNLQKSGGIFLKTDQNRDKSRQRREAQARARRRRGHVAECLVAASRSDALKDHSSSARELHLSDCVVILATSNLSANNGEADLD
jgi:hypothetical protein